MAWPSAHLPTVSPSSGEYWPLGTAAIALGVEEKDLKDLIRLSGIRPAAKMQMRSYDTSGRASAAYDAKQLIAANELLEQLREIGGV